MPYLTITRISGDPERLHEGYRRSADLMTDVGRDNGLLLHAAAKTDDGLLVVNLWPSREGSEGAARDPRRQGVLEQHGLRPEQFHREHYEVVDYMTSQPK